MFDPISFLIGSNPNNLYHLSQSLLINHSNGFLDYAGNSRITRFIYIRFKFKSVQYNLPWKPLKNYLRSILDFKRTVRTKNLRSSRSLSFSRLRFSSFVLARFHELSFPSTAVHSFSFMVTRCFSFDENMYKCDRIARIVTTRYTSKISPITSADYTTRIYRTDSSQHSNNNTFLDFPCSESCGYNVINITVIDST